MIQEKLRIDMRQASESELSEFATVLYWAALCLAELGFSLTILPQRYGKSNFCN